VHIARNVEKLGGKKVSKFVGSLSATFSNRMSAQMLEEIEKISSRARTYLQEIPPEHWRGTAWLDDPGLPPRYGITTSNISESTNNMFEKARDKSWLFTMHTIILSMMERITTLRNRVKGREGVVGHVKATLWHYWEECAGFRVVELESNGNEYTVRRSSSSATESERVYNVNIGEKTCLCGEWQDQGYPCIDAMAYLRLHKKMTLNSILLNYVDKFLRYETEYEMMRVNIVPVCIETLIPDGCTLPPNASKRQAGRPRRRRIRKRPNAACDPEESPIMCSKCHRRGHNARTCLARRENESAPERISNTNESRIDIDETGVDTRNMETEAEGNTSTQVEESETQVESQEVGESDDAEPVEGRNKNNDEQ
jgi:hypothetical protein